MTDNPDPTLRAAMWYARQGFSVFPLHTWEGTRCSCGDGACRTPGKHPVAALVPHGVLDALADERAIAEWWASWPNANVGIATGDGSGIVVLDVDPRHGGDASLGRLEARHGAIPDTWVCETGGGGLHVWLALPAIDVRNSAGLVGLGIDVRGSGGYVVAPPSTHASGRPYRWSPAFHPRDVGIAPMPDWLARLCISGNESASPPLPHRLKEGMRNTWLASAAGTMRRRGFGQNAITAALKIENRERCDPILDDHEVERIARSIARYDPRDTMRSGP